MTFDYLPLRLRFTALDAIRFPAAKAGNALRGAIGLTAAAATLVHPPAPPGAPSGLADPPRPFVLRPRALNGRSFAAGEPFELAVHLFDLRDEAVRALADAFDEAAAAGFGPGRGRARLDTIRRPPTPTCIPLDADPGASASLAMVEFLSPTELKPPGPPEFAVLLARARDRVSTLRALYGAGPLPLDFRALGDRAHGVRMTGCELREVEVERRSSRTGQTHGIGGFVGRAEYAGPVAEFLPLLHAAEATGVGRHTVWGNGEIRVE
jgi:hypothetical protein